MSQELADNVSKMINDLNKFDHKIVGKGTANYAHFYENNNPSKMAHSPWIYRLKKNTNVRIPHIICRCVVQGEIPEMINKQDALKKILIEDHNVDSNVNTIFNYLRRLENDFQWGKLVLLTRYLPSHDFPTDAGGSDDKIFSLSDNNSNEDKLKSNLIKVFKNKIDYFDLRFYITDDIKNNLGQTEDFVAEFIIATYPFYKFLYDKDPTALNEEPRFPFAGQKGVQPNIEKQVISEMVEKALKKIKGENLEPTNEIICSEFLNVIRNHGINEEMLPANWREIVVCIVESEYTE